MINRVDIEQRERETLAGYAALAAESRGRVYPLKEHPLRTAFQRDRDRVVHAAAFRRMEFKTQVFLPHVADHFRTRLTHTIEVAQVARTLARNLRLNEDLTEAIALVHDVGHTPFGHAGEDVLNDLLADTGGFNHNRQSLRVVDFLEHRYREHPGLNLSFEVREGIVKHETSVQQDDSDFAPGMWPTLEATLVDKADSLTYSAHDIDDGLNSGLITLSDIDELGIWKLEGGGEPFSFDRSGFRTLDDDQKRYQVVRYLINATASDLLRETSRRLETYSIASLDDVRRAPERLCRYSESVAEGVTELRWFLREHLYRHPKLLDHTARAREIIEVLFSRLCDDSGLLPPRYQEMLLTEPTEVVAADYIAGMTDRFAERLFVQLKRKTG